MKPSEAPPQVPPHAKLPTYDRRRDGNVFDWIVRTAQQVREKRLDERNGPRPG